MVTYFSASLFRKKLTIARVANAAKSAISGA